MSEFNSERNNKTQLQGKLFKINDYDFLQKKREESKEKINGKIKWSNEDVSYF
jgi:hypothetical protein